MKTQTLQAREKQLKRKAVRLNLKLCKSLRISDARKNKGYKIINIVNSEIIAGENNFLGLDEAAIYLDEIEKKYAVKHKKDDLFGKCQICHLKDVAKAKGYVIEKSHARSWRYWNHGGYRLYYKGSIALGKLYDCTLDDIEQFFNDINIENNFQ